MSTAPSLQQLRSTSGALVIDGISYIPSNVLLTGITKLTLKDDRAFAVLDPKGEAPRVYEEGSELGMYFNDTRYLTVWELTLNGSSPVTLSHESRFGGNTIVVSMTNRDMPSLDRAGSGGERIPRDRLLIRRIINVSNDRFYEMVIIRNFDSQSHMLQIEQWAASRFDDIFEVRGFPRERRGKMLATRDTSGLTTLRYEGLDGATRQLHIRRFFKTEKIRISPGVAGHFARLEAPAKGDLVLKTIVSFDEEPSTAIKGHDFASVSVPDFMELISATQRQQFSGIVEIETDHAIVNRAIQAATEDIRMLITDEPLNGSGTKLGYPYAGVPWYSAPFGRDGILTAYQLLPWHPGLARGVLSYVFETLGRHDDPFTDAQPGKVFHEMRRGEMARTREVPFIPYYGSVDATPLALVLLHEYIAWTNDQEFLRQWWPRALEALEWINRFGDTDGDGFVEYLKRSPTGLDNQGWKDSVDSIMHDDGRLAEAPIRLCEVQGYVFHAKLGMAKLASLLGHDDLATKVRLEALQLRSRFYQHFWDIRRQYIYLALDGQMNPCRVRSSNMGHCLWSGILHPEHAEQVTDHLMSEAMFSGYGIRTLADTETAYNPLSYHNGSIWPHDNSLILEGFRNYRQTRAIERLSSALLGVLETSSDFRMPELFCGFRKRGNEPPVPYEVACKPQAWAAGSVFLMLKAMIGLSTDADLSHVVFRSPVLTSKIRSLQIRGLKGPNWELDLLLQGGRTGTHLSVTRRVGDVRVLMVK